MVCESGTVEGGIRLINSARKNVIGELVIKGRSLEYRTDVI